MHILVIKKKSDQSENQINKIIIIICDHIQNQSYRLKQAFSFSNDNNFQSIAGKLDSNTTNHEENKKRRI